MPKFRGRRVWKLRAMSGMTKDVVRLDPALSWSQSTSESKVAENEVLSFQAVRDGFSRLGPCLLSEAMPASPMAFSRAFCPLTSTPYPWERALRGDVSERAG